MPGDHLGIRAGDTAIGARVGVPGASVGRIGVHGAAVAESAIPLLSGLLRIANIIWSRKAGKSPILASTIVVDLAGAAPEAGVTIGC